MVKCHKCGHNNEEGHEFCEECGSKLKVELKCKKCGLHLKPDDDFCEECGTNVKEPIHHRHKEASKLGKYKWWVIVAVIILILGGIFVFAIPLPYSAKEGYTDKVPYEAQETYSEKEPYTATETYYESESYQGEDCQNVYPKYNRDQTFEWVDSSNGKISCTITNFEDRAAVFTYTIQSFQNGKELGKDGPRGVTIGPGQTITKSAILPSTSPGNYACNVESQLIQKCKIVTKFRDVPKTKDVTQYKDIQKTRTVTKYKDEYKERFVTKYATFFQQWSGKAKYYYKV